MERIRSSGAAQCVSSTAPDRALVAAEKAGAGSARRCRRRERLKRTAGAVLRPGRHAGSVGITRLRELRPVGHHRVGELLLRWSEAGEWHRSLRQDEEVPEL